MGVNTYTVYVNIYVLRNSGVTLTHCPCLTHNSLSIAVILYQEPRLFPNNWFKGHRRVLCFALLTSARVANFGSTLIEAIYILCRLRLCAPDRDPCTVTIWTALMWIFTGYMRGRHLLVRRAVWTLDEQIYTTASLAESSVKKKIHLHLRSSIMNTYLVLYWQEAAVNMAIPLASWQFLDSCLL